MRATDRQAVQLACLLDGSRMSREVHVRFCERLGVQLPGPTLPHYFRFAPSSEQNALSESRS